MSSSPDNQTFRTAVRQLQSSDDLDDDELAGLLETVVRAPEACVGTLGWMLLSPHAVVRQTGLDYLTGQAPDESVDLVLQAMLGADAATREQFAAQLARLPFESLQPALFRQFHARTGDMQRIVLDVVRACGDWRDYAKLLGDALRGGVSDLRMQVTRLLAAHAADPSASSMLTELLSDSDAAVRHAAIAALCRDPTPALAAAFFATLPDEPQPEQRLMIRALGRLSQEHGTRIVHDLYPILAHANPGMRSLAVQLFTKIPARAEALRGFLKHARGLAPWLRDRAFHALVTMTEELLDPLLQLTEDEDPSVRAQAIHLAAGLEDSRVVPIVARVFLGNGDWWVRSMAADVLAKHPSEDVVRILLARADDPEVRASVAAALASMESAELAPHLIGFLQDRCRATRATAIDGLGRLRTDTAVAALRDAAVQDPDPANRERAATALLRAGPIGRELDQRHRGRETAEPQSSTGLQMVDDGLNVAPQTEANAGDAPAVADAITTVD